MSVPFRTARAGMWPKSQYLCLSLVTLIGDVHHRTLRGIVFHWKSEVFNERKWSPLMLRNCWKLSRIEITEKDVTFALRADCRSSKLTNLISLWSYSGFASRRLERRIAVNDGVRLHSVF
jgi:hypothetical protein